MLDTEQRPDREVLTLLVNDKGVMWRLGIASSLVAIPILWLHRSTRAAKPRVLSKARVVNGGSASGSDEPENDKPAESVASPVAATNRLESVGGLGDRPPLAAPTVGLNVGDTNPAKLSRTFKIFKWAVAVFLVVLSFIALFTAVRTISVNQSPNRLSKASPRAALPGTEEPLQGKQRTWIGVSLPKAYPLTKKGGGFAIELWNLGKTPALQASFKDYVVIEELDRLTGAQEAASHPSTVVGTLAPGSGFVADVWFTTSAEAVLSLSEGKVRAVNYAFVTYEDAFHRTHTTRSCSYWHGGLSAPLPCEGFNTAE